MQNAWHDSRTGPGVSRSLVLSAAIAALPGVAFGQPWADAYKAGDHAKAVQMLQPIIVSQQLSFSSGADPLAPRLLAVLYAEGKGVARDPVVACTLAQLSDMAKNMAPVRVTTPDEYRVYQESLEESGRFARGLCDPLTDRQQRAVGQSLGCLGFGLNEAVLAVGDRTVWVDRTGLRLTEAGDTPPGGNFVCPQLVARVAARHVEPPSDAAPGVIARSFVEVLAWQAGQTPGEATVRYLLSWTVYEVRGNVIQPVAMEELDAAAGWPSTPMPQNFDETLHVEMIRSGHIRWRLDGAPPKRGWILLPEERSR